MSNNIVHIETITEAHQILGLPKPKHPQISVFRHKDINISPALANSTFSMDMYLISLKDKLSGLLNYGRKTYDFQEGTMVFIGPNQTFAGSEESDENSEDWMMLFDADFIRMSELGETIDDYHFFSYDINEALHLSEDEKQELTELAQKIEKEYQQNIDKHTQEIILINIESILKYCQRYYDRQFYTRTNHNKEYITLFEKYLKDYMAKDIEEKGIPSVSQCGKALNMSGHYLSDLLKMETGKSAKEHIDLHLVNKAKTILYNSNKSISEVAYSLGFEYPNHFSKFFKSKTGHSPSEFRNLN